MARLINIPTRKIYQLKITLRGSKPRIWRRFTVPGDYTLFKLHLVIQIVMGWSEMHLHEFIIDGASYGEPSPDYDPESMRDHNKFTLEKLLQEPKKKFGYIYDFGDGWQHEIAVEKIFIAEPRVYYSVCLAGKMACPPEDCGGMGGYGDLLRALKNPRTKDQREFVEWAGPFDPERFELDTINAVLKIMRGRNEDQKHSRRQ